MRKAVALNTQMNLTPLLGVLLALTAVVIAAASQSVSAQELSYPPAVPGTRAVGWKAPRVAIVSLFHSGEVFLWVDDDARRVGSLDELRADLRVRASGVSQVYVRAEADVPYGRAAELLAVLEAAGYDVGIVGEDIS